MAAKSLLLIGRVEGSSISHELGVVKRAVIQPRRAATISSDWPRVFFVLPGALEALDSVVIIRWYCADMIVFFECSHSSTFGDVRVVNDVRKLNQRPQVEYKTPLNTSSM